MFPPRPREYFGEGVYGLYGCMFVMFVKKQVPRGLNSCLIAIDVLIYLILNYQSIVTK